ncbi:MAG: GNAT family N-acetyltransferase [Gammaproteobacteria bacterium]|nr:GNAT family N-acetyltransferase [Gammaproteobacteria bacterium]
MAAEPFPGEPLLLIEPLDPGEHHRAGFSCGIARLDNYLKYTARKHHAGDFTRVWVATRAKQKEIVGFYALNAHSLLGDQLPADLTRNAPLHGGIPAIYLSMIAVNRPDQGQGIGRFLLADALTRSVGAADQIGLKTVVLDVIDDGGSKMTAKRVAFYGSMGFQTLPGYPTRMFIGIETIRRALSRSGKENGRLGC